MSDTSEQEVINFGDEELSDVCLVVGDTDFNVHKMTLACRSSYFKTLFFGDFKEKHEKRITIEADPGPFKRMLEILYEGHCVDKDFFICDSDFLETFWREGVPLWELLDRFDVQLGLKYFEKKLNKYCCPAGTPLYASAYSAKKSSPGGHVSTCSNCVLRKIFAMQHGINLKVSKFDSSSVQSALNVARTRKIVIDAEILTDLVTTIMCHGVT